MWCTRWYLPLLILPFSRASPLFLVAFLFSLTLQARPCVYCVVLLVALAQSSCYWQAIPVGELNLSKSPPDQASPSLEPIIDGTVRLIDHCWCEFTTTNFFHPFDVDRWQLLSIDHERKLRQKEARDEASPPTSQDNVPVGPTTPPTTQPSLTSPETERSLAHSSTSLIFKVGKMLASWSERRSVSQENVADSVEPTNHSKVEEPTPFPTSAPLLRRQYDLRPHGLGVVVDFGWGRR
ncbi:uncharacterized protein EI90DRAFT_3116276 [Cantharellus anzutake]|uniref:uncharacterized protein n=1 Tax=Cantharellus anzutake TaxID=1750568 RepID=UPI001905F2B6|nr:uncharacterized protein EI90DRAFT_3116276 [Cantharellus anzutake]KAF8342325.1 hypothetical protein EI90DRAFT_3116276 [Cantharellus anzutake]